MEGGQAVIISKALVRKAGTFGKLVVDATIGGVVEADVVAGGVFSDAILFFYVRI